LSDARGAGPRRPFDWVGAALLTGGLIALLELPVVGHRAGWAAPATLAAAAVALGLGLAFVGWEMRARAPLLALGLFASGGCRAGLGLIIPALNVGAVQTLPDEYLGHAAAAVNFARQLGGAVGVNLLAVLLEWRLDTYLGSGGATPAFRDCFLVVTIAFAAAVIPALAIRKLSRH